MARLIDANALLMNNTWEFYNEGGSLTMAGEAVKNAPTIANIEATLVGIVECKDCKWLKKDNSLFYCDNDDGLLDIVSLDEFCSRGERHDT